MITSRYSNIAIPSELFARLNSINTHRGRLTKQADTFSSIYHHPGYISRRWYLGISTLRHPHIITTQDRGLKVNLYILHSKKREISHLKMNRGLWWPERTIDEADVSGLLPNCSSYSGFRLTAPATQSQIRTLERLLQIARDQLPKLTAFNANLLIQESILQQHIGVIQRLIDDDNRSRLLESRKRSHQHNTSYSRA